MNVFIRKYQDEYHWFVTSAEQLQAEHFHGSLEELGEYIHNNGNASINSNAIKHCVLIAPALDVAARTISYSSQEKAHIKKAIPYLLEEHLLSDADDIHIVTDKPGDTSVKVIAIDKSKLQQWVDELKSVGITPTHCMPEVSLLKPSEAQWLIVYTGDAYIFCSDTGDCAAFEPGHFALAIELLTENYSQLPESIELVAEDESSLEVALKVIPEALMHLVTTSRIDYASMVEQQFPAHAKTWDLLKGKFAQSRQWLAMFMPWRWVLAGFFALFCLHTIMVYSEYRQAVADYEVVQKAMEGVARQVIPRGKLVNPRQQLGKLLESVQGKSSGGKFIDQLNVIGKVLNANNIEVMNSINYDADKKEMRLDFLVADYDRLNAIISGIKETGLEAEIQNSVAQDDALRARISVRG